MNKRIALLALLLIGALVLAAGCTKSNDGDSGDDDDDFVMPTIEFEAADGDETGIWLELASTSPENFEFELRVRGDGIARAFGVAARLEFDKKVATLETATAGDALAGGPGEVIAQGGATEEGGAFGVSRTGTYTTGADISADQTIATLRFTVVERGETDIVFSELARTVLDPDLASIDVASWRGGTLRVE
jgi:hypothetical protein